MNPSSHTKFPSIILECFGGGIQNNSLFEQYGQKNLRYINIHRIGMINKYIFLILHFLIERVSDLEIVLLGVEIVLSPILDPILSRIGSEVKPFFFNFGLLISFVDFFGLGVCLFGDELKNDEGSLESTKDDDSIVYELSDVSPLLNPFTFSFGVKILISETEIDQKMNKPVRVKGPEVV